MSEYGIKIKNFIAGSIKECNAGVRDTYDYTDAMLSNSLFSDFLKENGLHVWKEESTRDIICIDFKYGSRDYETEVKHIHKIAKKVRIENKIAKAQSNSKRIAEAKRKKDKITELYIEASENKDKYKKVTRNDLREDFYENGVDITYKTHNKSGEIIKQETIHYKMLFRTTGKAKKGSCMFINESLYDIARDYLYMGIKLPDENSPIVEIGAYAPLITSSIVGKVQILPSQILVLEDVDSFFNTRVASIETDENKQCIVNYVDNYKLKNTLFDGQALIDSSIFPEWGEGYILLRQHMCKMAAFNTNIQLFMQEYYGDKYDMATIIDMFGREVLVKDIKLITTDNAIKWLKFGIDFDYWAEWVKKNDCYFGIVKTAHESKLGDVQRMSYQMVNALDIETMEQVTQYSTDYINLLKNNNEAFLEYLKKNYNFSNDYEVLVALCEHNPDFINSEYFRNRKKAIINTYVLNLKSGRVLQNADNLVIIGSPYAMLLHSVGQDALSDDTFSKEEGCIQCYTGRFNDGEYLAEFRSPFNSRNNLGYLHNVYHPRFDKYFNFGKLIIAVNMIGTDFQDRNNGSDQDSDSLYVTNHPDIVTHAKYCYLNYPTIVNNIPKEKNNYSNTLKNYAIIDNNLAAAQRAIGESSNLAQICLTYTYNFKDQKYQDYVCILSVLAQIAIDNAKRRFDIDLNAEIKRIKNDMDISKNKLPKFWDVTHKDVKKERISETLTCPMNWVCDLNFKKYRSNSTTIPMSEFFIKHEMKEHGRKSRKVEELIQRYSLELYSYNTQNEKVDKEDYLLLRYDFDKLVNDIQKVYISRNYLGMMSWLINRAFNIGAGVKRNVKNNCIETNKALLLKVLYAVNQEAFLQCFKEKVAS